MAQTFVETLKDIRSGEAIDDLTDALRDVTAAVRATGKAGKVTYTIVVKPASRGDVNTLMLNDAVTVKKPVKDTKTTVFFSTDENVLQRNDPRQPELTGLRRPAEVHAMRSATANGE